MIDLKKNVSNAYTPPRLLPLPLLPFLFMVVRTHLLTSSWPNNNHRDRRSANPHRETLGQIVWPIVELMKASSAPSRHRGTIDRWQLNHYASSEKSISGSILNLYIHPLFDARIIHPPPPFIPFQPIALLPVGRRNNSPTPDWPICIRSLSYYCTAQYLKTKMHEEFNINVGTEVLPPLER